MRWRVVAVSFAAAAVVVGATAITALAGRSNDNLNQAQKIKSFPFVVADLDTAAMTVEDGEALPACAFGTPQSQTIWYRIDVKAEDAGTYAFDTTGSTYDTLVGVWHGEPPRRRDITLRPDMAFCDDDNNGTLQSRAIGELREGTYFIQIGDYGIPGLEDPHTLDLKIERLH
jgi:hypothetical protein